LSGEQQGRSRALCFCPILPFCPPLRAKRGGPMLPPVGRTAARNERRSRDARPTFTEEICLLSGRARHPSPVSRSIERTTRPLNESADSAGRVRSDLAHGCKRSAMYAAIAITKAREPRPTDHKKPRRSRFALTPTSWLRASPCSVWSSRTARPGPDGGADGVAPTLFSCADCRDSHKHSLRMKSTVDYPMHRVWARVAVCQEHAAASAPIHR
jgi:hypothetical protein